MSKRWWCAQVTGVFARRGYNVQSLAVGNSEVEGQSRITMVIPGSAEGTSKIIKQLNKLVHVQQVGTPSTRHALLTLHACLLKQGSCDSVSSRPAFQMPEVKHSGKALSVTPSTLMATSATPGMLYIWYRSVASPAGSDPTAEQVKDLSSKPYVARELMLIKVRCNASQRRELSDLADIFHGTVCDVSLTTITLELQGKEDKMHALQGLLEPYGESAALLECAPALCRAST